MNDATNINLFRDNYLKIAVLVMPQSIITKITQHCPFVIISAAFYYDFIPTIYEEIFISIGWLSFTDLIVNF